MAVAKPMKTDKAPPDSLWSLTIDLLSAKVLVWVAAGRMACTLVFVLLTCAW